MRQPRRNFICSGAGLLAGLLIPRARAAEGVATPAYLGGHEAALKEGGPRAAALQWFRAARLGLFVHYNCTSLLPGGKFDPLPVNTTFAELGARFRAERFDAEAIADLAVEAGARYVCFTPYHGGGPYLWRTTHGRPSSVDLPAGRDLVAEMSAACHRRGLGYFHYVHVSLAQSDPDAWPANRAMLHELATRYGPIAGWWFDTSRRFREAPHLYPRLRETFALLRVWQPFSLISFCEGPTGEEDYLTFEHRYRHLEGERTITPELLARHRGKPVEICTTLQLDRPGGAGTRQWFHVERAYRRNVDEVWAELRHARSHGANFLLNTGPRGDGSVHVADAATLRALGARLRREGFPDGL